MNALVTGSSGFAGSYLSAHLRSRGYRVVGLSRSRGPETNLLCDLLDLEATVGALGKLDLDRVFHLAACASPRESLKRPHQFLLENVQTTTNLLEALRRLGQKPRVLMVSTGQLYVQTAAGEKIGEGSPVAASTPYSLSKQFAELISLQYWSHYSIPIIIARPFNHFGPGQKRGYVLSDFCSRIVAAERSNSGILRVGPLDSIRDFLDVRDVVQAYAMLIEQGQEGAAYNVCSGSGVAIKEILKDLLAMVSRPIEVHEEDAPARTRISLVGDPTKLKSSIDWEPEVSRQDTLKESLEYWRSHQLIEPAAPAGSSG